MFNLYDDTFYEFIKMLFKEDLLSFYKMYYALTTKFKFDMTYVQSITPAETRMYLTFVQEDVSEKKKQIEDASRSSPASNNPAMPNMPVMPPMPDLPDVTDPSLDF